MQKDPIFLNGEADWERLTAARCCVCDTAATYFFKASVLSACWNFSKTLDISKTKLPPKAFLLPLHIPSHYSISSHTFYSQIQAASASVFRPALRLKALVSTPASSNGDFISSPCTLLLSSMIPFPKVPQVEESTACLPKLFIIKRRKAKTKKKNPKTKPKKSHTPKQVIMGKAL